MDDGPQTASRIRAHLSEVAQLRKKIQDPGVMAAIAAVKQLQSDRFRATYADFLRSPTHKAATRFFLEELYGETDFTERDTQFGRIAGAIERLFPDAVGKLAVDLAEIHVLSERLDRELAQHWVSFGKISSQISDAERYVLSWRATGQRKQRHRQLAVVLHMGRDMQQLTRIRSLQIGLKMMRKPAHVAGLAALQKILEGGFNAFASMGDANTFLTAIETRESAWMTMMFEADLASCADRLATELSKEQDDK